MRTILIMLLALAPSVAWASGPIYTDNCTITWTANTEADLAGYKLYTRSTLGGADTLLSTTALITQTSCAAIGTAVGQHFLSISAFDTSGNESAKSNPANGEFEFALTVPTNPPPTQPSSGGSGGGGVGATIIE